MKTITKGIAPALYGIPVLGQLARIVVSLARLPALRQEVERMQDALGHDARRMHTLSLNLQDVEQRQAQAQQELQALLVRSEETQSRLATLIDAFDVMADDHRNLMNSVPVALRQAARDLAELRSRIRTESEHPTTGVALADAAMREPV